MIKRLLLGNLEKMDDSATDFSIQEEAKIFQQDILEDKEEKGPDYEWSLKDFRIGAPIGRGKFGRIYVAKERNTGYVVAIKLLMKTDVLKHNMMQQVCKEMHIQSRLNHPHILNLLTYFCDEKRIYLVLEYASRGELYKYLQQQPNHRLSEEVSAKFIYQVADAIEYCHKNGVIHRDIKPENLLLLENGDIVLADFGWSVDASLKKRKIMCGTIDYLPPEMIENQPYTEKVDHWCVGVLCYEFVVGRPPFESITQNSTFERIRKVDVSYPAFISRSARDLISKLLRYEPDDRLSMAKVKRHKWIAYRKPKAKLNFL